jgi:cytidylate kinase
MAKKVIITIARQYGSGGREIGEIVARMLNIPLYDRELITEAATKGSFDPEVVRKTDEAASNSLLYTLAMGSNVIGTTMHFGYNMPLNDKLFILQSEVIRGYAEEGSCVIIGRCADYVLKDKEGLLRVFVYGDIDERQDRILARYPEVKPTEVISIINKTDRRRGSYYNFYTGNKWGRVENYDMALNSSALGIEGAARLIATCAREIMNDIEH